MDWVILVLFILVLVLAFIGLTRMDTSAKNKYKKEAYRLLETLEAEPEKVKSTIRGLHLYGGRMRKDKECAELIRRLQDKFNM
jgi:hypothetical protein